MAKRLNGYYRKTEGGTERFLLYINDKEDMCLKICFHNIDDDELELKTKLTLTYYNGTGSGIISRIKAIINILIHGSNMARDIEFNIKDISRIKGFINEKVSFTATKPFLNNIIKED